MFNALQSAPVLAFPFRPFFLLCGVFGVLTVVAWMSNLFGGIPLPLGWSPMHWHSHEMLFGLCTAAIAGFLLTAMCNWTGAPPLRGAGLLGLVSLWLAGRLAMWAASWLPAGLVALIDLAFLPCVAGYTLRVLLRHGNKRNLILVGILACLSFANLLMHIGFVTGQVRWITLGQLMALNVIGLIMIVIGGRIIPLFTANWLRNRGGPADAVRTYARLDRTALIATALLIPADCVTAAPWLVGTIALIAATANGIRLFCWSGWRTGREPLLWILHIGYAWIVLALLLKSASAFTLVGPTPWQHALGIGAMATMIIGVMTRVALGHTGRALDLPAPGVVMYLAILFAATSRVLTALHWLDYQFGLMLAALGWTLAFSLFLQIYWPILTRPRADCRSG